MVDAEQIAKFVAPGRCTCCGTKHRVWTPTKCVEALLVWIEQHGKEPNSHSWHKATPHTPSSMTAREIFGSWNNFREAAGLERVPEAGTPVHWTKDLIADAMLDWLCRTGSWPKCREWMKPVGRVYVDRRWPSWGTVIRHFDTWNDAKRYAGWNEGVAVSVPRGDRPCAGCGGEQSGFSVGCRTCSDRRRKRAKKNVAAGLEAGSIEPLRNSSPYGGHVPLSMEVAA